MVWLGIQNLYTFPSPDPNFNFPCFDWVKVSIMQLIKGNCMGLLDPGQQCCPGLENFVPALSYHLCLDLAATISQPLTAI